MALCATGIIAHSHKTSHIDRYLLIYTHTRVCKCFSVFKKKFYLMNNCLKRKITRDQFGHHIYWSVSNTSAHFRLILLDDHLFIRLNNNERIFMSVLLLTSHVNRSQSYNVWILNGLANGSSLMTWDFATNMTRASSLTRKHILTISCLCGWLVLYCISGCVMYFFLSWWIFPVADSQENENQLHLMQIDSSGKEGEMSVGWYD